MAAPSSAFASASLKVGIVGPQLNRLKKSLRNDAMLSPERSRNDKRRSACQGSKIPGQAKAASEESSVKQVLVEMQLTATRRRGILLVEHHTMDLEDEMLQRFDPHGQRSLKKNDMDDFKEDDARGGLTKQPKEDGEDDEPERKKTRWRRFRPIRATGCKGEEDEELREKLDKELIQYMFTTAGHAKSERGAAKDQAGVDRDAFEKNFENFKAQPADRTKTGVDREGFEKNFDLQVKKLAQDKRAEAHEGRKPELDALDLDDEDDFGLIDDIRSRPTATDLELDSEGESDMEDDLMGSCSDLELDSEDDSDMEAVLNEEAEVFDADSTKSFGDSEGRRNPLLNAVCPGTLPLLGPFCGALVESIVRHIHSGKDVPYAKLVSSVRKNQEMGEISTLGTRNRRLGFLLQLEPSRPYFRSTFHQVVTPAVLTIFDTSKEYHKTGTYAIGTISVYLAVRVPENLALQGGDFPLHMLLGIRIEAATKRVTETQLLMTASSKSKKTETKPESRSLNFSDTTAQVIEKTDTWTGKSAFLETFGQAIERTANTSAAKPAGHNYLLLSMKELEKFASKTCMLRLPTTRAAMFEKLQVIIGRNQNLTQVSRRHVDPDKHRPLAIESDVAKLKKTFEHKKDKGALRERAEDANFKKLHKKARKGGVRELYKVADFMASEEGREANAYDEVCEEEGQEQVNEIQCEEAQDTNICFRMMCARKRVNNICRESMAQALKGDTKMGFNTTI
ncbi:hypothetical protein CEK25_005975 [Fusarium fujikuroi]|nr:hypothetical protein CEK25_005975 [Fusarium fujikuroi]